MKKILNFCKFVAFAAILITVQKLCYKATEGFTIERIKYPLQEAKEPANIEPHLLNVLEQPFHFLGSGGQCYAFESADGQYVLKVFKQHHLRLPYIVAALVPDYLNEFFDQKEKRFIASCRIAADDLSSETGVVFAHLENQTGIPEHIVLIDKLNIAHQVPSASLPFLLQKKAQLFDERMTELLAQGKLQEAISAIDSILSLVERRCQKGIADNDTVLNRNFGFIGQQAVEVDIGPFSYDPRLLLPDLQKKAISAEFDKFREQIIGPYPQLKTHLDERIQQLSRAE